MMDFTEFVSIIGEQVKTELGKDIRLEKVNKIGQSYTGLVVETGEGVAWPCFNMDAFYEDYLNNQKLDEVMQEIKKTCLEKKSIGFELLDDYNKAKHNLYVRLSGAEKVPANVPFRSIADMAMTCHVMLGDAGDECIASVTVNNDLLGKWGVTKEDLFREALETSARLNPPALMALSDFMELPGDTDMIILSSKTGRFGASVICYPGVLDSVAEKMDGDFYLLPSSVHEMIVLPVTEDGDTSGLWTMVKDVNHSNVIRADDVLTDSVYRYYAADKQLLLAF